MIVLVYQKKGHRLVNCFTCVRSVSYVYVDGVKVSLCIEQAFEKTYFPLDCYCFSVEVCNY